MLVLIFPFENVLLWTWIVLEIYKFCRFNNTQSTNFYIKQVIQLNQKYSLEYKQNRNGLGKRLRDNWDSQSLNET